MAAPPYIDLPTRINSGDARVITNGSVIAFDEKTPVEITFTIKGEQYGIVLDHAIDAIAPTTRLEFLPTEGNPKRIRVRIINIQGTPIGGLPNPAKLWTGPGESIFLQLRYISPPGFSPLFHFTVYLKPQANGSV